MFPGSNLMIYKKSSELHKNFSHPNNLISQDQENPKDMDNNLLKDSKGKLSSNLSFLNNIPSSITVTREKIEVNDNEKIEANNMENEINKDCIKIENKEVIIDDSDADYGNFYNIHLVTDNLGQQDVNLEGNSKHFIKSIHDEVLNFLRSYRVPLNSLCHLILNANNEKDLAVFFTKTEWSEFSREERLLYHRLHDWISEPVGGRIIDLINKESDFVRKQRLLKIYNSLPSGEKLNEKFSIGDKSQVAQPESLENEEFNPIVPDDVSNDLETKEKENDVNDEELLAQLITSVTPGPPRTNPTEKEIRAIRGWTKKHPYPNINMKKSLAVSLGLTTNCVSKIVKSVQYVKLVDNKELETNDVQQIDPPDSLVHTEKDTNFSSKNDKVNENLSNAGLAPNTISLIKNAISSGPLKGINMNKAYKIIVRDKNGVEKKVLMTKVPVQNEKPPIVRSRRKSRTFTKGETKYNRVALASYFKNRPNPTDEEIEYFVQTTKVPLNVTQKFVELMRMEQLKQNPQTLLENFPQHSDLYQQENQQIPLPTYGYDAATPKQFSQSADFYTSHQQVSQSSDSYTNHQQFNENEGYNIDNLNFPQSQMINKVSYDYDPGQYQPTNDNYNSHYDTNPFFSSQPPRLGLMQEKDPQQEFQVSQSEFLYPQSESVDQGLESLSNLSGFLNQQTESLIPQLTDEQKSSFQAFLQANPKPEMQDIVEFAKDIEMAFENVLLILEIEYNVFNDQPQTESKDSDDVDTKNKLIMSLDPDIVELLHEIDASHPEQFSSSLEAELKSMFGEKIFYTIDNLKKYANAKDLNFSEIYRKLSNCNSAIQLVSELTCKRLISENSSPETDGDMKEKVEKDGKDVLKSDDWLTSDDLNFKNEDTKEYFENDDELFPKRKSVSDDESHETKKIKMEEMSNNDSGYQASDVSHTENSEDNSKNNSEHDLLSGTDLLNNIISENFGEVNMLDESLDLFDVSSMDLFHDLFESDKENESDDTPIKLDPKTYCSNVDNDDFEEMMRVLNDSSLKEHKSSKQTSQEYFLLRRLFSGPIQNFQPTLQVMSIKESFQSSVFEVELSDGIESCQNFYFKTGAAELKVKLMIRLKSVRHIGSKICVDSFDILEVKEDFCNQPKRIEDEFFKKIRKEAIDSLELSELSSPKTILDYIVLKENLVTFIENNGFCLRDLNENSDINLKREVIFKLCRARLKLTSKMLKILSNLLNSSRDEISNFFYGYQEKLTSINVDKDHCYYNMYKNYI